MRTPNLTLKLSSTVEGAEKLVKVYVSSLDYNDCIFRCK